MSVNSGYSSTAQWDEMPEEAMARAEEQLSAMTTQSDSLMSNYGWLIFIGIVVVVVALMLIYLAGKYRRDRMERPADQESPLFDEITEDTLESELVFDEVEDDAIEPVMDWEQRDHDEMVTADPADEPLEQVATHDDGHEYATDERQGLWQYQRVEDSLAAAAKTADDHNRDQFAGGHDMAAEETTTTDDVMEADSHQAFEDGSDDADIHVAEDEAPRYAFASGDSNATFSRPETADTLKDTLQSTAAVMGEDEDGKPYIAPFIREDIDRSEQRQAERIDGLRSELSRQLATLKSEQASRLDLVISAIDRKLESLDRRQAEANSHNNGRDMSVHVTSLGDQVERITSAIDGQGQRIRAITTILENRSAEITKVYDEIKSMHGEVRTVREDIGKTGETVGAVKGEIDEIKENVGKLERAILDRAAQDSSTIHRLTDVIRGTLPDDTYSFGTPLANGETADCLIAFDGLKEKVAIDAGFPMEAFHDLPSRDAVRRNLPQAKVAEDAFRRAILRSILEAADRCISPAETADSCLLFLPSEAAYTILHDRFPDLVRDSQRARVWLVSPSTLMGTLNLIRNLLPDATDLEERANDAREAAARKNEESRLRDEVESLRRRAGNLTEELDRTRATLRDLISSTEKLHAVAEPVESEMVSEEFLEAEAEAEDDIIEGLRFEGTPEWESPKRESRSALFDQDRNDPLR